jgi:DNA-binding transcriptional MerR regulator
MSAPSSVPVTPACWYTIGEIARLLGLTAHTLRFYEKEGLLKPRRHDSSGYRAYDDADVRRLHFIRNAHDCGFPLD